MPIFIGKRKLKKELTLFDVYAVSTGAMFSSGFFLLPGLAAAEGGPSVVLAYLCGGLMVLPALLSIAELGTAMPRSGGAYYFLDRALGPMVGTVAGLGTWLALMFKSAFALVGMGAYLSLFMDVPIRPIAIAFALTFMGMNIIGVKKSTGAQGFMVVTLLSILVFFIVSGLFEIFSLDVGNVTSEQFTPFMPFGVEGFIATIGLIFVSFAGLESIASISEEVKNPDKNLPLGMLLSLLTATLVYVIGVYVMVAVLDTDILRQDLTPVATAAEAFLQWMPGGAGVILMVVAAVAAFASTGNAGIMSAARYPFSMARDQLIWKPMSKVGRFKTPSVSIVFTTALMIVFLLVLDVEQIAKLASSFILLIFGLLNLAVIVMRESKIEEYVPGFKTPLYPWVQIMGILITIFLIPIMGLLSMLFTIAIVAGGLIYFFVYASKRVEREGAIYHVYARLGRLRYSPLERELRGIIREKTPRKEDPYDNAVRKALVFDIEDEEITFEKVLSMVSTGLTEDLDLGMDEKELVRKFKQENKQGLISVGEKSVVKQIRLQSETKTEIVLVRFANGIVIDDDEFETSVVTKDKTEDKGQESKRSEHDNRETKKIKREFYAVIFLVSSVKNTTQHLRILSHLAEMIETQDFIEKWLDAEDQIELRETLLRDERFINVVVSKGDITNRMIGQRMEDLYMPGRSMIAMIKRNDEIIFPSGDTKIEENDKLSIIGEKSDIEMIEKYFNQTN